MDRRKFLGALLAAGCVLWACHDEEFVGSENGSGKLIALSGEIDQQNVSRVDDGGFCDGDEMGVYIVDYVNGEPGELLDAGNRATNVKFTFDEAAYRWDAAYDVYWKDDRTPIDVYGYYPFGSPESVRSYAVTVQKDQSKASENGVMGGYEASDFLWGKAENIAPTTEKIKIAFRHRMANVRVMVEEGSGFAEGEWTGLTKQVLVTNTKREAVVDLTTGTVELTGEVATTGIIPFEGDGDWRAIVVPQTVAAGTELFRITVDGQVYEFSKGESMTYNPGKMHNFTIQVNKKVATGEFEFKLIGESVTAWENDLASHEASTRVYVVIESEAGKLRECIMAANKDFRELRNLKITGEINGVDFYFMRDSMDMLQALNLKEVKIAKTDQRLHFGSGACQERTYGEDEIPEGAMSGKTSLQRLVLPDKLKIIHIGAFEGCKYLTGSLVIPEGVTEIRAGAFVDCSSLNGSLSLPTTLRSLGDGWDQYWYGGAFQNTGFVCELKLPTNLEYIGHGCFMSCRGVYGELHLPDRLKTVEENAFNGCLNLSGSLEIPQGVTMLLGGVFQNCGFDGTLLLHDGITTIGDAAFSGCHFKGELVLPKDLIVIANEIFYGCDFSGELKLPEGISRIGDRAFANNWRLMGVLEIPENVLSIGAGAFANCRSLEGVIFSENVETIRYEPSYFEDGGAFQGCYGITSMVCKGTIPPYVQVGAFDGVAKDNFALEVPESYVDLYAATPGWSDFKRITAHRELVCRPSLATAINTECARTLVLDAEGDWEVQSKPDWVSLSQESGFKKTELTLTFAQKPNDGTMREGKIVFKLKDKDYTSTCSVTQYDYTYGEDEVVTLQTASRGKGINLVFLGDGFNAADISAGEYMKTMQEQMERFFDIEPYRTYRDYFNVYTAIAVSPESGIGTVNTIRYTRCGTTYTGGVGVRGDYDAVFEYAMRMPTVDKSNLSQTLIVMTPNSTDYGGICQMWDDGSAIAFCPLSNYGNPLDSRGVIQHEAGGHGFGKLGDEYIYHNEFIDFCQCTCCPHVYEFNYAKSLGWYENLSLTGKMNEVPWAHLIFDERYSDVVDIFEGGFMHNRGVYRSEANSCMNNDIPYYSAISREAIVKRIMEYAGEEYSFEKFVENDKRDVTPEAQSRSADRMPMKSAGSSHFPPQIHRGKPDVLK